MSLESLVAETFRYNLIYHGSNLRSPPFTRTADLSLDRGLGVEPYHLWGRAA